MRTWFYRHPNVAVVLLGLWLLFAAAWGMYWLEREVWLWVALHVVVLVFGVQHFFDWWRRT